jgi:hypothetical protein
MNRDISKWRTYTHMTRNMPRVKYHTTGLIKCNKPHENVQELKCLGSEKTDRNNVNDEISS